MESDKIIDEALRGLPQSGLQALREQEAKKKPNEPKKGFLENPKSLRNARSISVFFVVIVLPLLYFLISENFKIESLLSWQFGSMMVITSIGAFMALVEIRKRGFEDTVDLDTELTNLEIEVTENGLKISEQTLEAIPILNEYNDKLQQSFNLQKTEKKKDKLSRKVAELSIKENDGKRFWNWLFNRKNRISRKKKRIEKMTVHLLKDKKFKRYRLERLLSSKSSNRYIRIGDSEINVEPSKVNAGKAILKLPLKGLGMSLSSGVIPLALGAPFGTILAFYGGYIGTMSVTLTIQYIFTKYKTNNDYRFALKRKKNLQEMIFRGIEEKRNKPQEMPKTEQNVPE